MNIVMDTNVLYHLYGRNKLGMVDNNNKINNIRLNALVRNNDSYITSITLIEIMTRFRSNPEIIRDLFQYIVSHNFSLISLGISDISYDDLVNISNSSNDIIKFKIKQIIKDKIRAESHFASIMLLIELEQYYYYYFEKSKLFNKNFNQYPLDIQIIIRDSFFEKYFNCDLYSRIKRILRKALKNGYSIDQNNRMADKYLKRAFDEILKDECASFLLFLNLIIDSNLDLIINWGNFENINMPRYQSLIEQIINQDDYTRLFSENNNINRCIRNVLSKFEKQSGLAVYEEYKFQLQETSKPIDTKIPVEYIGKMMDHWLINGSKYEKNDILDMPILRVLTLDKFVLITFDEMMQEYIREIHHASEGYIDRVYNNS